ncbi:MAG TPA: 50S ribosomal protein L9 [Polyangiaceae bacterium]|nr:50S ribosomal protein L9 [Polyangiaceae bacterium]
MGSNVKVLLQSDVESLGSGGEVVRVRAGYARNFLLPRGLAMVATAGNLKRVDELKRAAQSRAKQEREKAQAAAGTLSALSLTIQRAVGEEGKMYGSVTSKDIEEAVERAGASVERRRIQLPDPIRQLGSYSVPVKLHGDVVATLKVEVVKKTS